MSLDAEDSCVTASCESTAAVIVLIGDPARLSQIVARACREEPSLDVIRVPGPVRRGGLAPGALRRVREHIEHHLGERITLRELAAMTGLSECHFSRAFKQSLGVPPHRFVMQRRIDRAARLIETTERPLAEIALEAGFSDQSHFTRMFAGLVGETPREFRQRHR